MTASHEELHRLRNEAYQLPLGPARFTALDNLFRHADASGDLPFAFDARLNAVKDFYYGGDPGRAFLAFSWCLSTFDREPVVATSYHAHTLLWRFKWIVWSLPQFPDIPLDRTNAVLDDMQRRYQLSGHSLHAVYQHRWLVAHHLGDLDQAQHWYDQMVTANRDRLSDCEACVPSTRARHLASVGRDEEAIRIAEPVRHGGCDEQPQWILTELLLPSLRTGRLDEAVHAHRDAYRRMRGDRHHLENIAQHLLFCGLTGNEARGLEILERHLPWLDQPHTPFAAMEFASAAALVGNRLTGLGQGDVPVQRRTDDATRRWASTVSEVSAEMATTARRIAAEFDARNGNSHQSDRTEQRMAQAPVVDYLPISVTAAAVHGVAPTPARPNDPVDASDPVAAAVAELGRLTAAGDVEGSARAHLAAAAAMAAADRYDDALEAAEEAVRALDRCELAAEAGRCRLLLFRLYRRNGRAHDAARGFADDLLAQDTLEPADRRALLEESAYLERGPVCGARLLEAADLARADSQRSEELRLLLMALPFAAPGTVPAALDRAETLAAAVGPGPQSARLDVIAARHLCDTGRADEGLARIERGYAGLLSAGMAGEADRARMEWATLARRAGRPAAAEAVARIGLADERSDDPWSYAAVLAAALLDQGRRDDAEAIMDEYGIDEGELEFVADPEDV